MLIISDLFILFGFFKKNSIKFIEAIIFMKYFTSEIHLYQLYYNYNNINIIIYFIFFYYV